MAMDVALQTQALAEPRASRLLFPFHGGSSGGIAEHFLAVPVGAEPVQPPDELRALHRSGLLADAGDGLYRVLRVLLAVQAEVRELLRSLLEPAD